MAYDVYHWDTGTLLSAQSLNHMETQYSEAYSLINGHLHDSTFMPKAEADEIFYGPGRQPTNWDAATIDGQTLEQLMALGFPKWTILLWRDATPPTGWVIRDDLESMFLPCENSNHPAGETCDGIGVLTGTCTMAPCTLTASQMPNHVHTTVDAHCDGSGGGGGTTTAALSLQPGYGQLVTVNRIMDNVGGGQSHDHGTTMTWNNVTQSPPFIAYYFIQKVV